MLGNLNPDQINDLLAKEIIGRIGCSANNITYVVPVTYAYDDGYIYAHSTEGMKIQMMRMNPMVCFEVDQMDDPANWKSVIVWGRFEELKGDDKRMGLQKIICRMKSLTVSETSAPKESLKQNDYGPYKAIIYRIKILERSGRYEKH